MPSPPISPVLGSETGSDNHRAVAGPHYMRFQGPLGTAKERGDEM